jgi:UDP-N-acetylmuramate: L-alanyl-gamma-D-glutamyl-meso-diaminopimelate ligase
MTSVQSVKSVKSVDRVHLIGICGTAMGTLAALLKHRGLIVSGSDEKVYPPMSDFLAAEGITVLEGFDADHLHSDIDLVVVGNAISRGNVELEAVLDRRLRHASLPEAVRDQFLWDAQSIVIAGTHGKTTTTSLVGWILTHGGADPTVFVGGIARNFGEAGSSYRVGKRGGPFVIEGDEYDSAFFDKTAKFLKYLPSIAVVNNIEFDHADIYDDLDAIRVAFRRLLNLVPRAGLTLLGADSPEAAALAPQVRSRLETFGTAEGVDWRATDLATKSGETSFRVFYRGQDRGTYRVPLVGAHNVRNTLVAIALGHEHSLAPETIREGLRAFRGVKRRLELIGSKDGIDIYDDFAHHPTAVAETLAAVRAAEPGRRVWALFEPRSASSCRRVFQDDFARAFAAADRVVIASIFRSSLAPDQRLSEDQLVADLGKAGVNARHLPDVDAIVATVSEEARAGDVVIIMSNGGFGGIHRKLLEAL